MKISIPALLTAATEHLKPYSQSPRPDAEVLLSHVLGARREQLLAVSDVDMSRPAIAAYEHLLEDRMLGNPVAYLTGEKEFYGLPMMVNPDVLVPRPTTELLIDHVLGHGWTPDDGSIVDVGTGSGAAALALADRLPTASVIGTDTSLPALQLAAANSRRLRMPGRISWRHGHLLDPVEFEPIGLIIANLPYLTPEQLEEPSLAHEPRRALLGGHDGLQLIRGLLHQTERRDDWRGLVLEFDPSQAVAVGEELVQRWPQAQRIPITDGQSVRGFGLWR